MRLGIVSDTHGVAGALRAVLGDGERLGVERWWVLGDLVLFGPHPVEVLEMLAELDDVAFVAGNTDRRGRLIIRRDRRRQGNSPPVRR